MKKEMIIYQSKNGALEFRGDFQKETIWANLQQIADLFETDKSGISRHIRNVYDSGELNPKATVAKIATVQIEGKRQVQREIEYYNLDLVLSVGYRVNSKTATTFRQWATKTLREHIVKGYTINKKRLAKNYDEFLQAVESVKKLLPEGGQVKAEDALELVRMFANTWLSLQRQNDTRSIDGTHASGGGKPAKCQRPDDWFDFAFTEKITMTDITISTMTDEKEIEFLRDKSSFNYTYDKFTISSLKKHFALKDSLYLLAKKGEEFVAFCSIDRDWWEDNFFFIREILVDPNFQKLGFGKQLMRRCIVGKPSMERRNNLQTHVLTFNL